MQPKTKKTMKNDYIHNEDGTTTIYVDSLDRLLEVRISTEDFHILENRGYNICVWWDKGSRTYYVRSRKDYAHRLLKGLSKGDTRQVHHIDGNGLNNTRGNLEVVTPSEHAKKSRPKGPIVGDSNKGVKVHPLTEAAPCRKYPDKRHWFRMDVNGIHYGTFYSMTKLGLHSRIAQMVVNEKATDEQIYADIWRASASYSEETITEVIEEVRRVFRTPNPAKQKSIKK